MKRLILCAVLTTCTLTAQEITPPSPTPFDSSGLSAERVDLFTGEYLPDQSDLVVRGADPITLPRFHRSFNDGGNCGGRWHLCEERLIVQEDKAWLQQTDGSVVELAVDGKKLASKRPTLQICGRLQYFSPSPTTPTAACSTMAPTTSPTTIITTSSKPTTTPTPMTGSSASSPATAPP